MGVWVTDRVLTKPSIAAQGGKGMGFGRIGFVMEGFVTSLRVRRWSQRWAVRGDIKVSGRSGW